MLRPVLLMYESRVQQLEARIRELEDQLSQNSRNSSKPPSSDAFDKPAPKSQRKKTGRKAGGQKGHRGSTLKMVAHPDAQQLHRVCACAACQRDLRQQAADSIERRQVYDVPPLELIATEHRGEVKRCSCGWVNRAALPRRHWRAGTQTIQEARF